MRSQCLRADRQLRTLCVGQPTICVGRSKSMHITQRSAVKVVSKRSRREVVQSGCSAGCLPRFALRPATYPELSIFDKSAKVNRNNGHHRCPYLAE